MMLTPCWPSAGPTGGAGVAAAALICRVTTARTFFFGAMFASPPAVQTAATRRPPAVGLDLRHLVEGQLDRCLRVEDVDQHLELGLVGVDLADRAVEVGERAGRDANHVAPFQPAADR